MKVKDLERIIEHAKKSSDVDVGELTILIVNLILADVSPVDSASVFADNDTEVFHIFCR